jgi:hypothetical protein
VRVEETFAKVVGRHPSEAARRRLYRLRDALGLRDNDAFCSIVMALEYYDSFFQQYPAQLGPSSPFQRYGLERHPGQRVELHDELETMTRRSLAENAFVG